MVKVIVGKRNQLPYTRLRGKIVSFADLARASSVFIVIYGWQPNPKWSKLESLAAQNGFCVEAY